MFFFFFSSRRRHTRSLCDWSSDVCSSDLPVVVDPVLKIDHEAVVFQILHAEPRGPLRVVRLHGDEEEVERLRDRLRLVQRSEERRVGKECGAGWDEDRVKKKDESDIEE